MYMHLFNSKLQWRIWNVIHHYLNLGVFATWDVGIHRYWKKRKTTPTLDYRHSCILSQMKKYTILQGTNSAKIVINFENNVLITHLQSNDIICKKLASRCSMEVVFWSLFSQQPKKFTARSSMVNRTLSHECNLHCSIHQWEYVGLSIVGNIMQ